MNVLIVGSGAREHTLAWKLRQSPLLTDLFVAPGNAGTAAVATNLPVNELDFAGLRKAAEDARIDLVVVGPEAPLAAGLADELRAHGLLVYGPGRAAAEIESSKAWAKELMRRAGIPTAAARAFDDAGAARRFVLESPAPPVVKADGLAAGKGVVVAETQAEALQAVDAAMTDGAFGAAGRRVLIEERLSGVEVSAHVFSDGSLALPMPFACDHKRIYDGDRGPNTGGMGAFSPPPFVDGVLAQHIFTLISQRAITALRGAGRPFRGTLYPGLMLTDSGPRVIEFNCRFGDPETQVLLPRLESDLLPVLLAAARGDLTGVEPRWDDGACVGVVVASGGYPGSYRTGVPIAGLDALDDDILVFHAGTALEEGGVVTAGGRVLTVVGRGATIAAARERVYANVERIRFDGAQYRRDIGQRGL
ncbi:MAG TPA: phosphoribosylamine--glycine ligase [Dehalococcoidia bacterium]|nr:phosphoribosylamine--glycine ligase [Dehalococcoidia bacterium]